MDRLKQIQESFTPFKQGGMIVDSVFNQMGSAIDKFVETGKFSFSDFTRSIIFDIEKILLKAAAINFLKAGASAMGFAIPGLAAGGGVQGGSPYMVGEQGPELFIPSGAGSIIPNGKIGGMGGNTYVTNNISAIDSKSVAQLFAENRRTLFGNVEQARRELPMRTR
jgi:phage-related minor tail protein